MKVHFVVFFRGKGQVEERNKKNVLLLHYSTTPLLHVCGIH